MLHNALPGPDHMDGWSLTQLILTSYLHEINMERLAKARNALENSSQ